MLSGRVARTGQRPHRGGEDAARGRMMGDAIIADEIGQHRGPVVVLGGRVERLIGPVAERLKGEGIFHVYHLRRDPQREALEEMVRPEREARGYKW